MAIAAAANYSTPTCKTWDLTALDADTGPINVAHAFGVTPKVCFINCLVSLTNALAINWSAVPGGTNIVVSKANCTGSGGTTPGTTVVGTLVAMIPHTLI